jgi:hypothetical protein
MHPPEREPFNRQYSEALFFVYRDWLYSRLGGPFPFRLAETPLFLSPSLLDYLQKASMGIVAQLSAPRTLAALKKAIPEKYDAPGMDPVPDCVQIDFALVRGESGEIEGRVVELQAFPSLYALETFEADAWHEALHEVPGLEGEWTCFFSEDRNKGIELMTSCILGGCDPREVALVDYQPMSQKTFPDFVATKKLFNVDEVCVTDIIKEGNKLYRNKDGHRIPIKRIYNRLVFDELEVKNVRMPFSWRDDLDITWCSHPNWYWTWSKYSLPHLDHPAVPKTTYLSDITDLPEDLENYVMKPLFSYAGSGVVVDVTKEAVAAVPAERRGETILQRKVEYAWVIPMPNAKPGEPRGAHNAVKAEVRVMLMRARPGAPLEPLLPLVRLSRGRMLGVDQNKSADTTWTGGSVGIWPVSRR